MTFFRALCLLSVGFLAGLTLSYWLPKPAEHRPDKLTTSVIEDVIETVQTYYVDSLTEQQLTDAAIKGIFSLLDPYSSYLTAEDLQLLEQSNQGEYFGFGFEVAVDEDEHVIRILTPFHPSPAATAGIMAGDIITHFAGQPVKAALLNDFLSNVRAHSNQQQSIDLTIVRQGHTFNVEISPAPIQIESVSAMKLDGRIGYLKITHFQTNTAKTIETHLRQWQTEPLKGLIIDLRDNPGGLLDQSIQVADLLLNKGRIVSTAGRYFAANSDHTAEDFSLSNSQPILVLINQGSASAAEVLAAALQDNQRALLVGETSFGKGTVQTVIPSVINNSAVKLTIARYFTPQGSNIHRKGIEPDIKIDHKGMLEGNNMHIIGHSPNNKEKQPDEILAAAVNWFNNSP
ncbi:S41 family peptidase [Shewanella sp. NIFS-20-20]|uniref:S41 family peptidase n=1 Tax=Shewanella sp. NIFS-20-20 TaxID=2853806 RepID=UPI001C45F973|nr:S41 family peptidase [Shewanella sp. NIFS-20-20]MBV7317496.1 S41 family peptidase [Shewanella sp. NIFS-20-20]